MQRNFRLIITDQKICPNYTIYGNKVCKQSNTITDNLNIYVGNTYLNDYNIILCSILVMSKKLFPQKTYFYELSKEQWVTPQTPGKSLHCSSDVRCCDISLFFFEFFDPDMTRDP